ncbi:MAG TPA: cupin domain-containing protein [Thermoanaerobaculia bacterium]|nr:cupin domain-containing protein [Thermoanaerobaculia bacterium]
MPLHSRRLWPTFALAAVTFGAGLLVGSARRADAEAPAMTPMILHVPALGSAELPPPASGMHLQNKIVAAADGATVQVQLGTVGKHYHASSNEVQYVLEGQGKFWLGDSYKDVGPGDLIIIPKGTAHGGTTTPFKAIAIKTPPQAKDDLHPVP